MSFDWLKKFHHESEKADDYAEKTLAQYRLGLKAKGSIAGVAVQTGSNACAAAVALPAGTVYHPDHSPRLPLPSCPHGRRCQCVYRPVMTYQQHSEQAVDADE